MLEFRIHIDRRPLNVLLLGAHCDDIEIGCGGTVMELVAHYPAARFRWVTLSSDAPREAETRAAANRLLAGASDATINVEKFRGSYFPYCGIELKDYFESMKEFQPDLILTHYRNDLHQDHRTTNELTWNTFRNHLILEYEVPKYDGDFGVPNTFVPLSRTQMRKKCEILLDCFPSQLQRSWFTQDTFESVARLRGIECNAPEGYAEAFYGRKIRFDLT